MPSQITTVCNYVMTVNPIYSRSVSHSNCDSSGSRSLPSVPSLHSCFNHLGGFDYGHPTCMFSGGSTPSQSAQNRKSLHITRNLSHIMSKMVYTNSPRISGLKLDRKLRPDQTKRENNKEQKSQASRVCV